MMKPVYRETLFFYGCFLASLVVLWPLALPIGLGAIFAYLSENLLSWLQKKLHLTGKKGRAFLTICLILFIILLFLVPITLALYTATKDFISFAKDFNAKGLVSQVSNQANSFLQKQLSKLQSTLSSEWMNEVSDKVKSGALSAANGLFQKLSGLITAAPGAIFAMFLLLLSWFSFAFAGPAVRERFLQRLLPWQKERTILCETTGDILRSLILSNVIVALVQASICTLALAIFKVPRFLLWGVLAFFASFVPAIGTAVITLGAAAYLFLQHRLIAGVSMLVVAILVATVDNILRPWLMKGKVDLGFFWVLSAFFGGVAIFGVAGVVLGPLILSLCLAFFRSLEEQPPPESIVLDVQYQAPK